MARLKKTEGWINCTNPCNLPVCGHGLLFSDGKKVWAGWLETYEPCGEPVWYCPSDQGQWPENIIWWREYPEPPKKKE